MAFTKRAALLGAAAFALYALLCAGCSKPADDTSAPPAASGTGSTTAPTSQKAPVAPGAAPAAPPPLPGPPPGPK